MIADPLNKTIGEVDSWGGNPVPTSTTLGEDEQEAIRPSRGVVQREKAKTPFGPFERGFHISTRNDLDSAAGV